MSIGMACDGVGLRGPSARAATSHAAVADEVSARRDTASDGRYAESTRCSWRSRRAERMAFWKAEFDRCMKCYACRQVCPLCYCERCVADKNRPTVIDTSATLKGNFAWHITRAFHLAGRCVGCDECTRACPAGIDLRLLNLSLARRPRRSSATAPAWIRTFRAAHRLVLPCKDKESFIR